MTAVILMTFLTPAQNADTSSPRVPFIISVDKTPENITKLQPLPLDILMDWEDKIYIIASVDDLFRLKQAGIHYVDETLNFPSFSRVNNSVILHKVFHILFSLEIPPTIFKHQQLFEGCPQPLRDSHMGRH